METQDREATTTKQSGLSRRSVIGGAAWTIPVIAVAAATPLAAASSPQAQYGLGFNFSGFIPRFWSDPASGTQLYYTAPTGYRLDLNSASVPIPAGTPLTVTYDIRLFSSVTLALPAGPVVMLDANTAQATFYFATDMLPAAVDGTEPRYIGASATLSPQAAAGNGPFPSDLTPIVLNCSRAWGPLTTDISYL